MSPFSVVRALSPATVAQFCGSLSGSGFAQEITARSHRLSADEPIPNGGTDTGPTPYDLLLAALCRATVILTP